MVHGSGFGVQGAGFMVQGSGFRVQGSGFGVQGSGFWVWAIGLEDEEEEAGKVLLREDSSPNPRTRQPPPSTLTPEL